MRPIDRIRLDLELRGFEAPLDRIIESDRTVRELRTQVETLQAERNRASKGGPPSDEVKARMRETGERIKSIDAELGPLEAQLQDDLLWIPNVIDPAVPPGKGETENVEVRRDPLPHLPFPPKPPWGIGEA